MRRVEVYLKNNNKKSRHLELLIGGKCHKDALVSIVYCMPLLHLCACNCSLQVIRSSEKDQVLVVAAGVTTTEAITAHKTLAADGINIRVVDIFCLKPIDKQLLVESAHAAGNKVITIEDHYVEGEWRVNCC